MSHHHHHHHHSFVRMPPSSPALTAAIEKQKERDEHNQKFVKLVQEGKQFLEEKENTGEIKKLNDVERNYYIQQYVAVNTEDEKIKLSAEMTQAKIIKKAEHDAKAAKKYLKEHKHDNDLSHKIFNATKIIAVGCVAIIVPPVGGPMAILLSGAACAATNAFMQSAGVALNLQNKFSLNEAIEAATGCAIGGASAGLGILGSSALATAGAAGTQVIELNLDTREEFDLKEALMTGGSTLISSSLGKLSPILNDKVKAYVPSVAETIGETNSELVTSTLLNSTGNCALTTAVNGAPPSLSNLASSAACGIITNKLGNALHDKVYQSECDLGGVANSEIEDAILDNFNAGVEGQILANPELDISPVARANAGGSDLNDGSMVEQPKKCLSNRSSSVLEDIINNDHNSFPDSSKKSNLWADHQSKKSAHDDHRESSNTKSGIDDRGQVGEGEMESLLYKQKIGNGVVSNSEIDFYLSKKNGLQKNETILNDSDPDNIVSKEAKIIGGKENFSLIKGIESIKKGVESTTGSILHTLGHPIETAENLGYLIWDAGNAISDAAIGISSEASLERNADRLRNVKEYIEKADVYDLIEGGAAIATGALISGGAGVLGNAGRLTLFKKNLVTDSIDIANAEVKSHISGLRLQQHLGQEEILNTFTTCGELSESAIRNSVRLPLKINNPELKEFFSQHGKLEDWGKYETSPIRTNNGLARIHFYRNPVTGEVYYGKDYKVIFDHQGAWNNEQRKNFSMPPSVKG